MRRAVRGLLGLLFIAIMLSGVALLKTGIYGWTVFVALPMLLGAVACWALPPRTGWGAVLLGSGTILAVSLLLFAAGMEGGLCLLLSLPLTLPLGCLGAWFSHRLMSSRAAARSGLAMLLVLPPTALTFDTHAQAPVYAVKTAIEISAPPGRVWRQIIDLAQFPEPHEWYFRAGLAYPMDVRLAGTGPGATRYCEFSTGQVVESIEVWDEPHVLRFRVVQNPAPMREWSPWGEISPKHLRGYLISREGEFRLTTLAGNRTLLEGTSWYRHGLWPAQYWRLWSDAIVHRIHLRVFRQIKALAERS